MSDKNFKVKNGLVVTDNIGIGIDNPSVSVDASARVDAIAFPAGNSSQRPVGAVFGYFRYNTTIGDFEGYSASANTWTTFTTANSAISAAFLNSQPGSYYLDFTNFTGTMTSGHFDANSHGALGGGNLHANANSTVAGFLSSADKIAIDALPAGGDITAYQSEIGNAVNLNSLTATGWYSQTSDAEAAAGSNYPEGNAGVLVVYTIGTTTYQQYKLTTGTEALWHRKGVAGTFTAWRRVWDSVNLSNNQILTQILAVDGTGSTLDADLLDGQEGTYYANVVSRLGYTPIDEAGDTMLGKLTFIAANTTTASINIPHGAAPSAPSNGDIWTTTAGLFVRANSTTLTIADLASTQSFSGAKTFSATTTFSNAATPLSITGASGRVTISGATAAGITLSGANGSILMSAPSNFLQWSSATAGDPTVLANGQLWFSVAGARFRTRIAGATYNFAHVEDIGTTIQSYNNNLTILGSVTPVADRSIYWSNTTTAVSYPVTTFARTILDDLDATAARATLSAVNITGDTLTGPLIFPVANTTQPSLRIPHGTAPSAPTNGDIWSTTAGLLYRINGSTKTSADLETVQTFTGAKTFSANISGTNGVFSGTLSSNGSNVVVVSAIGVSVQSYNANTVFYSTTGTFTSPQKITINPVTYAANTQIDLGVGNDFSVTLTGPALFLTPLSLANSVGQKGSIIITQDGTGGRTASWQSTFKWENGVAPDLSTAPSAVDRADYHVVSNTAIHCKIAKGFA